MMAKWTTAMIMGGRRNSAALWGRRLLSCCVFSCAFLTISLWLAIFRFAAGPVDFSGFAPSVQDTFEGESVEIDQILAYWDASKGAIAVQAETTGIPMPIGSGAAIEMSERMGFWFTPEQLASSALYALSYGKIGRPSFAPTAARVVNPVIYLSGERASAGSNVGTDTESAISTTKFDADAIAAIFSSLEAFVPDIVGTGGNGQLAILNPIIKFGDRSGADYKGIRHITIQREAEKKWSMVMELRQTEGPQADMDAGTLKLSLEGMDDGDGLEIVGRAEELKISGQAIGCAGSATINGELGLQLLVDIAAGSPAKIFATGECDADRWKDPAHLTAQAKLEQGKLDIVSVKLLRAGATGPINFSGQAIWPNSAGYSDMISMLPTKVTGMTAMADQNDPLASFGLNMPFDISLASAQLLAEFPDGALSGSSAHIHSVEAKMADGAEISADIWLSPEHIFNAETNSSNAKASATNRDALQFDLKINDVNIATLNSYWPEAAAPNARAWVLKSIRSGHLPRSELEFSFSPTDSKRQTRNENPETALSLEHFFARFSANDLVTTLRPGMVARAPQSEIVVDDGRVMIDLPKAHISGLGFETVSVEIAPRKGDQHSELNMSATVISNLREQLDFLSAAPLTVLSELPQTILDATGKVHTEFDLTFPLNSQPSWDEMSLRAKAHIVDSQILIGNNLIISEATKLTIDDDKILRITGNGQLNDHRVLHETNINLRKSGAFIGRTEFEGLIDASQIWTGQAEMLSISGLGAVSGQILYGDGEDTSYSGKLDLSFATLDSPILGWSKPSGSEARLEFSSFEAPAALYGGLNSETEIKILCVSAHLSCDIDGRISQAEGLRQLVVNSFDVKQGHLKTKQFETFGTGSLTREPDGNFEIVANFDTLSLDPKHLIALVKSNEQVPALPILADAKFTVSELISLQSGAFYDVKGHIRTSEVGLKNVILQFDSARPVLANGSSAGVNAILPNGLNIEGKGLDVEKGSKKDTEKKTEKSIIAYTHHNSGKILQSDIVDVGAFIRFLGGGESITNGQADFIMVQAESGLHPIWLFEINVDDYILSNAPFALAMLKALTLGTLTDVAQARGLSFSEGQISGRFEDNTVIVEAMRSSGGNMAMTGRGSYDTSRDLVIWSGEIVPLSAVNSSVFGVFGSVPLFGRLFTGVEDSGAFAAKYNIYGELDNPTYDFNASSLLFPGLLRNIFFPDQQTQKHP